MKVLLIDDDASTRRLLEAAFRRDGWDVLTAGDGEEGWEMHGREGVSLLVSDWRMPRLDGLELCRRLRASEGSYTYFILVTAGPVARASFEDAMAAGVDDFLHKPLDLVQVSLRLRAARRLLAYAGRVRELEGIIPVCSYCRRLRDDQDAYHQMESYFKKHAGVLFSHGVCPDCLKRHFQEPAAGRLA